MGKIVSEFDFDNSIVLGGQDQWQGYNSYMVKGIKIIGYLQAQGAGWSIDAGAGSDLIDATLIRWINTTLAGGEGRDTIYGGWGADLIDGGADSDIVQSGPGHDVVVYDAADRFVDGGEGLDTLDASSFASKGRGLGITFDIASTKDAFVGFENFIGSAFNDRLTGDAGSNVFTGGAGVDTLIGGPGDDAFIIANPADYGADEVISGGEGFDEIQFSAVAGSAMLVLGPAVEVERARVTGWNGDIDASLMPVSLPIELLGSSGSNRLTGNAADNRIDAWDGDDFIDGGAGRDWIYASKGNDRVVYDAEDDVFGNWVSGGSGIDTLDASGAPAADGLELGVSIDLMNPGVFTEFEDIIGSAFNDHLVGSGSANRIDGGAGDDVLRGNADADVFVLSAGDDRIEDFETPSVDDLLLDFEGISDYWTPIFSYGGLYWSGAYVFNPEFHWDQSPGFRTVLTSPTFIASVDYYGSMSSGSGDFDFVSGNFAPPWADSWIYINAYDDGVQVGGLYGYASPSVKAEVDFAGQTAAGIQWVNFWGRFESIDSVLFISNAGQLAMDDLRVTFARGDLIDVPDGLDVAALIAGASADADGNAVLTWDDGTLTLVGVDVADLSVGWFV